MLTRRRHTTFNLKRHSQSFCIACSRRLRDSDAERRVLTAPLPQRRNAKEALRHRWSCIAGQPLVTVQRASMALHRCSLMLISGEQVEAADAIRTRARTHGGDGGSDAASTLSMSWIVLHCLPPPLGNTAHKPQRVVVDVVEHDVQSAAQARGSK